MDETGVEVEIDVLPPSVITVHLPMRADLLASVLRGAAKLWPDLWVYPSDDGYRLELTPRDRGGR